MALGVLLAAGAVPAAWAIGDGKYALLLGVNLYGLAICFAGFLAPLVWQRASSGSTAPQASTMRRKRANLT